MRNLSDKKTYRELGSITHSMIRKDYKKRLQKEYPDRIKSAYSM